MELVLLPLTFVVVFGGALALAVGAFWRAADALQIERDAKAAREHEGEMAWHPVAELAEVEITIADFREAGWSEPRAAAFLSENFGSRQGVRLRELRPFLGDVLVRDVLIYRRLRFDAAGRYEAIRHTWVNVEDLEREGRLPPELRPLVCERERQSGRLIRAGDLLPFVGRPLVRELLEERLADCGETPAAH